MTTRIKITNEGPENAGVWYYGENRLFKPHFDFLKPGESIEMNIWDGHLPVVLPIAVTKKEDVISGGSHFYAVPPTHY